VIDVGRIRTWTKRSAVLALLAAGGLAIVPPVGATGPPPAGPPTTGAAAPVTTATTSTTAAATATSQVADAAAAPATSTTAAASPATATTTTTGVADPSGTPATTVPAGPLPERQAADSSEPPPAWLGSLLDDLTVEEVTRLRATVATCGSEPARVCRWVLDATDNDALAEAAQWFVDVPVRIAVVLAVVIVLNRLTRAVIQRWLARLHERAVASSRDDPAKPARSTRRMATASSTLASAAGVAIYATGALVLLGEFGISLGPLLAGAGVVGLAIGFGAQNLVRDVLAGLFVLIEDQYGVGDIIDTGRASGEVEDFSLRMTKIRDVEGTLWFVPNGLIGELGNKSQIWSRAVLDIEVAYGSDLDEAGAAIKAAADRVWREQAADTTIIEEPALWGVERLGDVGVTIRIAVKCAPAQQWAVARRVRSEIMRDLDAAGIEIAFPRQALWVRSNEAAPPEP
jgi:small-conductance mechanosensitive channel